MLATSERTTTSYSDVSSVLWREREVLQDLLYKLLTETLIVSAGHTRWLAKANDDVAQALDELRATEVLRAAEVEAIAVELNADEPPSLAELATSAPEPWATIFADHRASLLVLVAEVEQATDDARSLLSAGSRSVRETLLSFTQALDTYDNRGSASGSHPAPMLMDEQA
jgi:hypothetical protein